MTCGAFGSGGVGAVAFGSGSLIGTSLVGVQSDENGVEVRFVGMLVTPNPTGVDPLDVVGWSIVKVDPMVEGSALPLVQAIEPIDSTSVRVLADAKFTPGQGYAAVYLPIVDDDCGVTGAASFVAYRWQLQDGPSAGGQTRGRFDLANPQAQPDAAGNVSVLGTMQVDSTGDLAIETGIPYLRKRIVRRLTTRKGAFVDLPGYGLAIPIGRLARASELLRIKLDAQEQIATEPDVDAVRVSLSSPAPGVVRMVVRVQTVDGVSDTFDVTVRGGSGA